MKKKVIRIHEKELDGHPNPDMGTAEFYAVQSRLDFIIKDMVGMGLNEYVEMLERQEAS